MPSGELVSPVITDNRDGTVKVQYEPSCEGLHELTVLYNGENVQGSPYKFFVDSLESGTVTAHGSGLVHGITGEPSTFTISSKNAGAGSLSLAVEGPSKAEISCHDNKDGTVTASYLPTSPGDYKVSVKFADKHIRGSPYTARVTGEGRKRSQISVGSQSEVKFPGAVPDSEITSLNAAIMAPSGLEEPCFIKKLPDGKIGISFTPREKGQHWVSLRKKGSDITGSPFKIEVSNLEVGDAARVMVSGPGIKGGKTQQDNTFTVDTRHAGFGGLSLSIEGPSKADISCKDNEDGTLAISYKPTEPGYYIINLKFADNLVDQSPYTVKVTGEGSNRQTERIHRQRDAAPLTEVGSQCRLTFKLPGISPYDLSSLVTSPAGESEAAETMELEEGLFGVNFVPKALGVHTVSVKYMDAHIPGSPFQFTVGPLKDGGAHRVHAGGPGLERGEVHQPAEFNVWTREAGAGALAISVEGPSKAVIDFKDRKDGSCYASYVVNEPGEYRVGIKFNEKHIPDSPFKVFVTPELGEARKVEVAQFPDQGAKVNKAQNCLIIMNGAKGEIDCKLVTPSGKEDDVFMDKLDEEVHAVRFVPRSNGVHYFHVKCKGIQIPGSPFRLRIGEEEADPAACSASGNGLKAITTGTKTDFIVDTCSAGAGTLAVTIDGPSKVSMDCTEVDNGYKVRYTPLVNGDYYVHVKYNNVHISGSPWKVKCTGMAKTDKALGINESSQVVVETVEKVSSKPEEKGGPSLPKFNSDASKVSSKGLGLKKAHPGRQNNFTINASQAGGNILYVGVYGPKGPCEEVSIKHMGHYNYQVGYKIKERGEYVIVVRYGDQQIPGSPFFITTTT